jgi:hypothetical protein
MVGEVQRRPDGGWPLEAVPHHTGPAGPTPARRPWSVRRTTTIDTVWPKGLGQEMHMTGHGRDLLTGADPARPQVLVEDEFDAMVSREREIAALATVPPRAGAQSLVGSRAGSQLRSSIAAALPEDTARGSPLHLLLDDVAGASLVAVWAWSQWTTDWHEKLHSAPEAEEREPQHHKMIGVCVGFSPQSPVVLEGGPKKQPNCNQPVGELDANGDPFGWHVLARQDGPAARRARRIDVWIEGAVVKAVTQFQDSAPTPDGGRMAVHEYIVEATIDRATMTLTGITADPRILPFPYCPAATLNIHQLVGAPVAELRQRVLAEFPKTKGCTHLNDVMRSLAEVPLLAAELEQAMAKAGAA